MSTGGDPDELDGLAALGSAGTFALDHAGRRLADAAGWHRASTPRSIVDARPAASRIAQLTTAFVDLDRWVRRVAAALRAADIASFATRLLALGPRSHLASTAVSPRHPPARSRLTELSERDLAAVSAIPALPVPWRDAVHRERLRRWSRDLDRRIAALPPDGLDPGLLDRVTVWADEAVVDRLSPVVDLHVTRAETVARLHDEVDGALRLLADAELTVLSFEEVAGRPTARVALGDVAAADHLAVVLPGTGSGLHALAPALEDATALHQHALRTAEDGRVATVLDLYAAPLDLGAATDPGPSRLAGAATAAFLADLPVAPHTTLVGHSYGALTAARASDAHPVADLVLLGAPGVGVLHRRELTGAQRVWAAQAEGDPITTVADLDEHLARLPAGWVDGPLADPLVAHGPDPADADFGARVLPTAATGPGVAPPPSRGHLEYLHPGTVTLHNVARIVVGGEPADGP